jgi:hypothetical protein
VDEPHRQEANLRDQRNPKSPAIVTIAVTGTFLVFYLLLWGLGELNIKGTEEAFIDSFGFHLWAAMAALSGILWVVLFSCFGILVARMRAVPRAGSPA